MRFSWKLEDLKMASEEENSQNAQLWGNEGEGGTSMRKAYGRRPLVPVQFSPWRAAKHFAINAEELPLKFHQPDPFDPSLSRRHLLHEEGICKWHVRYYQTGILAHAHIKRKHCTCAKHERMCIRVRSCEEYVCKRMNCKRRTILVLFAMIKRKLSRVLGKMMWWCRNEMIRKCERWWSQVRQNSVVEVNLR